MTVRRVFAMLAAGAFAAPSAIAEESEAELAKKLSNPVADLISVPLQSNVDCCFGDANGLRYTLNVQPVVPLPVSHDWNMIVRTITPIIYQAETQKGAGDHFGLGDITQSFFFSPRASTGLVWAVGPVFLWPAGGSHLGSERWAAGPTALVLRQSGRTTVGILANHLWSYAGDDRRDEVNATFLQPFFAYGYPDSTTISINSESSYDWAHRTWTVPVNAGVSHVYKWGRQRVQMGLFGRYFVTSPDGPQAGVRMVATFLFPR